MNDNSTHHVTIGGECFEASPRGELGPVVRDGLVYKFQLADMAKSRGKRLASVFAAGSLELTLPDYKQRIQTVSLNTIRRAFDSGSFSFDQPDDAHNYKELQLSASDFERQRTQTDAEIRQYIIHKAYWLGYRFPMQPRPDGIIYPIPFDEPADLDYLAVTSTDIRRNIRRLADQGFLEKVLEGHARPTERLLSQYESGNRSGFALPPPSTVSVGSGETDDRRFARLAIEEARKSVPEDERVHPKVGVLVVKDGRVLATAHRGEIPQCHAEYVALEKKLADVSLAGSTVYTTLEPCTSRNHPKVPCAIRLTERKVARVVIGMLDPDDRISGRGQRALRKAGIATGLFDHDLMTVIEELNRDFIREREATEYRVTVPGERGSEHSPVGVSPQTEAARRVSDATKNLQKAAWSFVELHSRYGVAQAARDVAEEEKNILQKVRASLDVFDRVYDLPTDLGRIAKEELASINISLDRLTSGHDLETKKIAAEQVQDSCHRIREATKPYAYLHADAGDDRRVQKVELPAARPIIVPKRFGGGVVKDDMGYTGLGVVNDGEQPGYDLTIHSIQLADGTKLVFHRGHTERLARTDGEAFYPAFLEARLGGTFGSALFDFMRERGTPSITVPITYRDSDNNWFQTDVTLERDVQKTGGLRLGWTQKWISDPTVGVTSISPDPSSIVTEPARAMTRNAETVLSLMTERKNWKRTDLAKLANISDDDTLQALRALKDADKVIPIDVDEEPKGTFWRRI
jgi:pyrimidine deaminase RibD-like protein